LSAFDGIRNIRRGPLNAIKWGTAPPRDPVVAQWLGAGSQTAAGANVTADSAMRVNAVYACINRISNTIAQTPLLLYQELENGGKQRDKKNPLYTLLHRKPNRWQTPFEFKQMLAAHVALRGNAYAAIVSTPTSSVSELVPLHPDRVMPFWTENQARAYRYQPISGREQILLQGEILHIQGLSFDGLKGLSPIEYCRESIGVALATEEHGARLFSNGAQVGMALKHPATLTKNTADNLKRQFEQRYSGVGNAHKTLVLEEGMTIEKLGLTAEDSQFLETRQFQVVDIARIWEMPLHMIGDLSGSTNNNIEQQSLEFVQYTMGPWFTRFEEALDRDLVYQPDRYFEFLVDGLLRGDIKSRYAAYAIGKQWGWLSSNDIREKENLNPIEGGDTYVTPLNMAPIDAASLLKDDSKDNKNA
jgi:HK97 family phage portal protein